jgi:hypothetical protein
MTVAPLMMLTVMMPVPTRAPLTPASTSIWKSIAPAVAAPPGTKRMKAAAESWLVAMRSHECTCRTRRYSAQMQT